jgi:hypothetical protein
VRGAILAGAVVAFAACTDKTYLAPTNDAATRNGIAIFEFRRGPSDGSPVTITEPNGEILQGHLSVMRDMGGRDVRAVSVSARGDQGTMMTCRGFVGPDGHGGGECETNHGARYEFKV